MIEDVCDTLYEAINWGISEVRWFGRAQGALADTLMASAERQTRTLQAWLAERLGDDAWFGGDAFGWADVAVAPYANRSFHNGLGPPADSTLARWRDRLIARPAVAQTFAEFEAAAERMGDAARRLASGEVRREYRDHRLEWMMKSGGVQVVLDGVARGTVRFTWPL